KVSSSCELNSQSSVKRGGMNQRVHGFNASLCIDAFWFLSVVLWRLLEHARDESGRRDWVLTLGPVALSRVPQVPRRAKDVCCARGVSRELRPESLKVPGLDLQLCGLQVWCWLGSTVLWFVTVKQQLDLSSMTARLRGGSCVVLSRVEEALSGDGGGCCDASEVFSDDSTSWRFVRRGIHARMTFGAWMCQRRGVFSVLQPKASSACELNSQSSVKRGGMNQRVHGFNASLCIDADSPVEVPVSFVGSDVLWYVVYQPLQVLAGFVWLEETLWQTYQPPAPHEQPASSACRARPSSALPSWPLTGAPPASNRHLSLHRCAPEPARPYIASSSASHQGSARPKPIYLNTFCMRQLQQHTASIAAHPAARLQPHRLHRTQLASSFFVKLPVGSWWGRQER
ncbi:hypothetical protein Taro_055246, partial [Colocasia esculenta]|nr:hypothetical protein [Colocasia esculenta]